MLSLGPAEGTHGAMQLYALGVFAVAASMDTAVLGSSKDLLESSLRVIAEGLTFKHCTVMLLLLTLMGVMQLNRFISLGTLTPVSPIN